MGTITTRRTGLALALVVGLLASLLLAVGATAPAEAAARTYEVRGQVTGPGDEVRRIKVRWFTRNWTYLGEKRVRNGIYTLSLAPGSYRLQFVDQRPAYDVTKYAPADIAVRVGDRTVQKDVRMKRGAAITGTVKVAGKAGKGARVVAANTYEQSYETKANGKGQFAIGGLPTGKYSVFTYDRRSTYVGKSTYAGRIKRGKAKNLSIRLTKKGGSLLVDLFHADGSRATGKFAVTAVSRKTGQWWTATARGGKVTFRGLYPGRYRLVAPGNGDWLPRTGPIQGASVRSGRADLASRFVWTKRGGSITGRVVDGSDETYGLADAQVLLFDKTGRQVGSTVANGSGGFRFGGQLTTQSGLAVVALPKANSGGWMTTRSSYCLFTRGDRGGLSITTGRQTSLPQPVLLQRSTASGQPATCLPA
jgi:hypothetical protein